MAGNLIEILKAGSVMVGVVADIYKQAKPVIDQIDTDEVMAAMKDVGDAVKAAGGKAKVVGSKAKAAGGKAAGSVAGNVSEAAKAAAAALGAAAGKVGDAKDEFAVELSKARSEKDLEKLVKEVRQSVLEAATTDIMVADLRKYLEKSAKTGAPSPISTMPGCLVIATYKKYDFDKDLTDYVSIYVGKAENAAEGVLHAISREGDPDVYADVKYKQNVRVFVFNCMPEDLDEQLGYLRDTFEVELG